MTDPFARSVATLSTVDRTQIFVALRSPKSGRLMTAQLREARREAAVEVELLKTIDWQVEVPKEYPPLAVSGGLLRDTLQIFWSGWIEPTALNALSLFQEQPIRLVLAPGEHWIGGPVVVASRKMHQFTWREEDGAGELWRHVFSGDEGQIGAVDSSRMAKLDAIPVAGTCDAVPRAEEPHSAIAWVTDGEAGLRIHAAHVLRDDVKILSTSAVEGIEPDERQRPGLVVGAGDAGPIVAGVVARNAETSAYAFVEARFDFESGEVEVSQQPLAVEPGSLQSGRVAYLRDSEEPEARMLVLTNAGNLLRADFETGEVRLLRDAVPGGYDFPLVASFEAVYTVEIDRQGEPQLKPIER